MSVQAKGKKNCENNEPYLSFAFVGTWKFFILSCSFTILITKRCMTQTASTQLRAVLLASESNRKWWSWRQNVKWKREKKKITFSLTKSLNEPWVSRKFAFDCTKRLIRKMRSFQMNKKKIENYMVSDETKRTKNGENARVCELHSVSKEWNIPGVTKWKPNDRAKEKKSKSATSFVVTL